VEQCSTDQSAKIDVEVKVGDNITNVDPIDWRQG
jgi:hypothetical protein